MSIIESLVAMAKGFAGLAPASTPVATIGGMAVTYAQVKSTLGLFGGIVGDFETAVAAKGQSFHDDAVVGEDLLSYAAQFLPQAIYAEDALRVLDLMVTYGQPIRPGDANYDAPAGNPAAADESDNAGI